MKREPFFNGLNNFGKISFGLVTVLVYSFILFNTSQFVPADEVDYWWRIITCYTVMLCLVMGVGDMRSKLFNIETFKFLPRFILFYIPSTLLLSQLLKIISPEGLIFGALWELPKWLLFVHGFVIATIESTIWQGYLDHPESNVGQPWSSLIAGVFHLFVWKGTKIFIFISASLLFALFSFINWYFRKDKDDLAPAIGFHTAYNHLKMLSLV